MKQKIRKHISNALGWTSSRKIIVFESDDWGSVRIEGKEAYQALKEFGVDMDRSNFTRFDCLEQNEDLEQLFQLLNNFHDKKGNPAVFTPLSIVANPDFEKIEASGFQEYYFKTLEQFCEGKPGYDKVPDLWRSGLEMGCFQPALHGREHLNKTRWMELLRANHPAIRKAFDYGSVGVEVYDGANIPLYLAAFHPEKEEEIKGFDKIIEDAGRIFYELLGVKPSYFIASNSPEPKELEPALLKAGVKYLTRYKLHRYPLGNGKTSFEFNWLGKKNKLGQIYLTRNASFEPSESLDFDSVGACLHDIELAFKWRKPAIISSHRVNFVGGVSPDNARLGREKLSELLKAIQERWPEAEFMSSMELAALIEQKH